MRAIQLLLFCITIALAQPTNMTNPFFGIPTRPNSELLVPSLIVMFTYLTICMFISILAYIRHRSLTKVLNTRGNAYYPINKESTSGDDLELLIDNEAKVFPERGIMLGCAFLEYRVVSQGKFCWKGKEKRILDGVSAQFRPGTLTGIMGPSGSGKTTLLNLLSGRTRNGEMEGYRLINSYPMEMDEYNDVMRKHAGYVLQTDTFFKDLTVRETLMYAAFLRLVDKTMEEKILRVDEVIREVGLEKVADTKVGDNFTAGISGGQKRRLSIAVELLSVPSIILLDEPTSGLDASTAHKLILLLKNLAESYNRTIITTIHSPRAESFAIFDDVLLLGQSGSTVYFGAAESAVDFFISSGFEPNNSQSPGDFIIDIVGLDPEDGDYNKSNQLAQVYHDSDTRRNLTDSILDNLASTKNVPPPEKKLSFWSETCVLFSRRLARSNMSDYTYMLFQVGFIGLLLAVAFGGKGFTDFNIWYRPYKAIMFIVTLVSYAMIVQYLDLVPQYFDERDILRRQLENGSCRVSTYFLCCILHETPRCLLQVTILSSIGYWLVDLNTDSKIILFFILFLTLGVSAWQATVSLCSFLTNDIGTVYNLVFFLLGAGTLFGGLPIIYSHIPEPFLPFYYTSIPAITYRALLHSELICCDMTFDCDDLAELGLRYLNNSNSTVRIPPQFERAQEACTHGLSNQSVNLGALALNFLDLDNEVEYFDLVLLMFLVIFLRILTLWIYKFKLWREFQLKDKTKESITQREKFD